MPHVIARMDGLIRDNRRITEEQIHVLDEEVQEWVRFWIHQRLNSFYKTGIGHLVSQWEKSQKLLIDPETPPFTRKNK